MISYVKGTISESQRLISITMSSCLSVFLQVSKGSANVLSKYSVLQQKEAQNLEVVAFCEDISKWVMIFLFFFV